jgi:hypothetical protein
MIRIAVLSLALAASLVTAAKAETSEKSERLAVILVATATFVDLACKDMRSDRDAVSLALVPTGITLMAFVLREDLMKRGDFLVNAFSRDVLSNCKTAWDLFGENGTQFPGLVKR